MPKPNQDISHNKHNEEMEKVNEAQTLSAFQTAFKKFMITIDKDYQEVIGALALLLQPKKSPLKRSSSSVYFKQQNYKKSYTDTTMYIPLVESIKNLQQGKSIAGSSSVNLVTQDSYDFAAGEKVPKNYKAHDGLMDMDIADISQMQRDLSSRVEQIEAELKNSDDKKTLILVRDAVKNQQKVSDSLINSIGDVNLVEMIKNYNTTIQ